MSKSRHNRDASDYEEENWNADLIETRQRRKEKKIKTALKKMDIDALSEEDEDDY